MYFLGSMFVQDPKVLENLNLTLSCQVLVPEEDNSTLID